MYGDATSINQILKMTGWVGAIGCSLETLHITFMFGGGENFPIHQLSG